MSSPGRHLCQHGAHCQVLQCPNLHPCRDWASCRKSECHFAHACPFMEQCTKKDRCGRLHPCRYGVACFSPKRCAFFHPCELAACTCVLAPAAVTTPSRRAIVTHPEAPQQPAGCPHYAVQFSDGRGHSESFSVQSVRRQLIFEVTLDQSTSMRGARLETAKSALRHIFETSMQSDDLMGLVVFDGNVTTVHRPMRRSKIDFARNLLAIDTNSDPSHTALYDGIAESIENVRKADSFVRHKLGAEQVTVLHLVITDGKDNSSKHSLADVVSMLQNPGAQGYHLHMIGVNLGTTGRQALEQIRDSHGGRCATLHLAHGIADFERAIGLVRKALDIVLEIRDGDHLRTVHTHADHSNFREVLKTLAHESPVLTSHASSLAGALGRLHLTEPVASAPHPIQRSVSASRSLMPVPLRPAQHAIPLPAQRAPRPAQPTIPPRAPVSLASSTSGRLTPSHTPPSGRRACVDALPVPGHLRAQAHPARHAAALPGPPVFGRSAALLRARSAAPAMPPPPYSAMPAPIELHLASGPSSARPGFY
eukprot:m.219898 g.219898  ORF g.219898 m.219898 type:complete len:536 (+) comp54141_c0_seq3:177-1784(+)